MSTISYAPVCPAPDTVAQSSVSVDIERLRGAEATALRDAVAVEEPLALELIHGPMKDRRLKQLSVTMRTPGNDAELAAGFLLTEGIVRDVDEIEEIATTEMNTVRVVLVPAVKLKLATLERNFYVTSSCGVCGKASLLALRAFAPPRRRNEFLIDAQTLYTLPAKLRAAQGIFETTGGLHAAGLFDGSGRLLSIREDVGRHNAVDKLIGAEMLADRLPLRDQLLLLSGRASFELLQKAAMAGIQMVASVGAPSSMAVQIAREHDIVLAGFLREDHVNLYHGAEHVQRTGV